jgi:hypothetical protein
LDRPRLFRPMRDLRMQWSWVLTHKTRSPWPLHFKHSHWWKSRARSKFVSHYARGTNGVCECKMDVKNLHGFVHGIEWNMLHGHLDYFQKPPLGGRPNTKPRDHGTPNAHNRWFILFYRTRAPIGIEIHWNSICWGPGHIWLHTTLEGPWPHPWCWRCVGTAFGRFLLGSHNFMVTALGSCVKWPLGLLSINKAHLELSTVGLDVGLNFSPTLQSGP